MKFFHLFQTEDEFNQAYTGDSYNEPWISFTRQTYVDGNSLIISGATLINYQSEAEETVHSMDVVSSVLTASGYTLTYNGFHIENDNWFYTFSGEPGLASFGSGMVRNPISGNTIFYQNNATDSVVSVQTTTVPIDGTYVYTDTINITPPFGNRMADVYTNSETGEVIFVALNTETPFVDGDIPIIDNPK